VPPNEPIPTPSQRVRFRRQAGLCSHSDDVPDSEFFGYNPTGFSDDEGEGKRGGLLPVILLLLPHLEIRLRLRKRRRCRGWWRLRWWSKSPSRNAERSRVRSSLGVVRNRSPYEGSSPVPRYRSRISEQAFFFLFLSIPILYLFLLFILLRCCKFCCTLPYHGHCIFVRVALFPNQ
jgi:hypothetical protein